MKKAMKLKKMAFASALLLASAGSFAAPVAGDSSTEYVVANKASETATEGIGFAGISMPGKNPPTTNPDDQSKVISFAGGPIDKTNTAYASQSGPYYYIQLTNPATGVITKLSQTWRANAAYGTKIYAYRQINDPFSGYPHFGGEVVAKVKDHEVYFGEWAPKGSNTGEGNDTNLNLNSSLRTVFYTGENPTTSMPNLSSAKYDVVAVRKYNPGTQAGVDSATLTVDYNVANGSGSFTSGTLFSVNFAGTNITSNGKFQNSAGITGQFYGANASALAGMYNPTGYQNDFAFGGAKR